MRQFGLAGPGSSGNHRAMSHGKPQSGSRRCHACRYWISDLSPGGPCPNCALVPGEPLLSELKARKGRETLPLGFWVLFLVMGSASLALGLEARQLVLIVIGLALLIGTGLAIFSTRVRRRAWRRHAGSPEALYQEARLRIEDVRRDLKRLQALLKENGTTSGEGGAKRREVLEGTIAGRQRSLAFLEECLWTHEANRWLNDVAGFAASIPWLNETGASEALAELPIRWKAGRALLKRPEAIPPKTRKDRTGEPESRRRRPLERAREAIERVLAEEMEVTERLRNRRTLAAIAPGGMARDAYDSEPPADADPLAPLFTSPGLGSGPLLEPEMLSTEEELIQLNTELRKLRDIEGIR